MACTKVAGCWQFDPSTAFCLHVYPLFTSILRRCIEFSREPATAWPEQIQQNVVHRRVVASVAAPAVFSRKSKLVLRILSCGSVRIVYQYNTPESRAAKPLKIQVCFLPFTLLYLYPHILQNNFFSALVYTVAPPATRVTTNSFAAAAAQPRNSPEPRSSQPTVWCLHTININKTYTTNKSNFFTGFQF